MIQSPVLIIGCPRSGTTLLFNILSEVPSLWSIGYESKDIIERYHHPRTLGWESGALAAADLTETSRQYMLDAFEGGAASGAFWRRLNRFRGRLSGNRLWGAVKQRGRSRDFGSSVSSAMPQQGLDLIRAYVRARNWAMRRKPIVPRRAPIRLVEKTPENCLRLPFLLALFPDARVLYLTRDGRSNVHSLIEGWMQPHLFPGYRVPERLSIPGYTRDRWAFTLIPGWRELTSRPVEEICAWQWIRCNQAVLAHRSVIARTVVQCEAQRRSEATKQSHPTEGREGQVPYLTVRYEDLVATPAMVLPQIAGFLGLDFERDLGHFAQHLPQINVVSEPNREKWRRKNPEAIARVLPLIEPMMHTLGYDSSS